MGGSPLSPRRIVFLDRDGVLNRAVVRAGKPYPPADLSEFEVLPGAAEACGTLRAAGFLLVVVTNQPDVARGKQSRAAVEALNRELRARVDVDEIRVCYHDDGDGCDCRKPLPGLLLQAALDLGGDLASSFMVGDRWRDIEAGRRAGCRTILVDYDYSETIPTPPDRRVASLAEAAEWILGQNSRVKDKRSGP